MSEVERIRFQGVEGVRMGLFSSAVNTTCIVYRLGSAIIDTGPPNQWNVLRGFVSEEKLSKVILTHHHEDHSGNVRALQRSCKPQTLAPALAIPYLEDGFKVHLYRRLVWGKPSRVSVQPVPDKLELEGGFLLRTISAPGHSPDMTCYLEPSRGWLFSGDLYVGLPRYLRSDEDLTQQVHSLRRVLEFDFQTLFCAHRGVVEDGPRAIRRKLDHLHGLCRRTSRLKAEGKSVGEISRILLGKEDFLSWFSGGHFRKRNLIESCLRLDVEKVFEEEPAPGEGIGCQPGNRTG